MADKRITFKVIGVDFGKVIDAKLVKCVLKMTEIFNNKNIEYKFNESYCESRNLLSFDIKTNNKWKTISTTYEFIEDCGDDLVLFEKVISDQIEFGLKNTL